MLETTRSFLLNEVNDQVVTYSEMSGIVKHTNF